MGFKSMADYNGSKYGNFFRLQNDGDYADVIFMYRGTQDVMMADTHYIKSDTYSGYVTCCGSGNCPACKAGSRIQPKMFIPLFVIRTTDASGISDIIQFWDRTLRFQPQLLNDVFRGYPDPSGYIFRITRHGVARDINTTYDIRAIMNNTDPNLSYDAICSRFGAKFPDYYNTVCRDVDEFQLASMMTTSNGYNNSNGANLTSGNSYGAVPRGSTLPASSTVIPGTQISYTGTSMPHVPLNAPIPGDAPAPAGITAPTNSVISVTNKSSDDEELDPLETNEDVDTTNLNF